MNISCRIANANTQCGRITNPPERKIDISKNLVLLLCFVVFASCGDSNKNSDGVLFYPNIGGEYFQVNYKQDTILITKKYKFKKYEYLSDTTKYYGVVEGKTTRMLVEKAGEYYLNKDGYSELFMSNRIMYSDSTYRNQMEGACHSIKIRKVRDSLYESTLYVNTTESHRNILLVLLYDRSYKIKNIKLGAVYVDYVMHE